MDSGIHPRVICTPHILLVYQYSSSSTGHYYNTWYAVRTWYVYQKKTRQKKDRQLLTVSKVVLVILTLTRLIKSVVTGQAPVTLEWKNTSAI